MKELYAEIAFHQEAKRGEAAPGDVFLSRRRDERDRVVCVLSDGLGSGVKANVLATLTATMALECVANDIPAERTAEIVMSALPLCRERKIRYATFSIADISDSGDLRLIEYDNPPVIIVRDGALLEPERERLVVKGFRPGGGDGQLNCLALSARAGDRLVFLSDGVTQAGMGTGAWPLGWGRDRAGDDILGILAARPDIGARELARKLVNDALAKDTWSAKDDITCAVISFRKPRKILIVTGPPYDAARDAEMAAVVREAGGTRVVCGGTTAAIVARELGREVRTPLENLDRAVPPPSVMEGVDLVTEGILTLGKVAEMLEDGNSPDWGRAHAAAKLAGMLADSDIAEFLVGTRVNEAHQDPGLPVELDIRRNVVKRIARSLRQDYLKEVSLRFV